MTNSQPDHDNKILHIINGLTNLWNNRAKVLEGDPSVELTFEPEKEDFKEELLPFCQHQAWLNASDILRQKVMSYGWIIYNEKTIQIESKLIAPVCDLLIDGEYPGSAKDEIQHAISQALVDEAFHTLMAVKGINIVYRERDLLRIKLPKFELQHCLERMLLDCNSDSDRKLVRLAMACASETLITDYLGALSQEPQLQPLCYKTVEAHAADEWGHASVFSYTMAEIFPHFSDREKSLYLSVLPKAIQAFSNDELAVWNVVLQAIEFPDYEMMLSDCHRDSHKETTTDVQGVAKLLNSLGIEVSAKSLAA